MNVKGSLLFDRKNEVVHNTSSKSRRKPRKFLRLSDHVNERDPNPLR